MMNLLVFSDLHGDVDNFRMLLDRYKEEEAGLILCAGDLGLERVGSIMLILRNSHIPFVMVRGNCDSSWAFIEAEVPVPPRYRTITFGSRTIAMTHGDLDTSWQSAPVRLTSSDIFITGHTHIARLDHPAESPWMLNPGSASRPRNSRHCSYAVISDAGIAVKKLKNGKILHELSATFL